MPQIEKVTAVGQELREFVTRSRDRSAAVIGNRGPATGCDAKNGLRLCSDVPKRISTIAIRGGAVQTPIDWRQRLRRSALNVDALDLRALSVEKMTYRLSADHAAGTNALSVPGSARASTVSSDRTQYRATPSSPIAGNTIHRPSGDTAIAPP